MKKIDYKPKIQVLYVEDDKNESKKYIEELLMRNIYVHHVDNLQDALDVLKKCEVEIVLSDGSFPMKKGAESERGMFIGLAEEIKKLKKRPEIIVIANSTSAIEYGKKNGIESYSKITLTKEHWKSRGRRYIKTKQTNPNEIVKIIEKKIAKKFRSILGETKFEKYYSEYSTILVMFLAMDMRTGLFEKTAGKNYGPIFIEMKDGLTTGYIDSRNDQEIAKNILDKFLNKNYFPQVYRSVFKKANNLLNFDRKLRKINFAKCSNKKLAELYKSFCGLLIEMRLFSSLPTAMEHKENLWSEMLEKILRKKIQDEPERNRVFSILTTPDKNSYLKEFELYLFKAAIKSKKRENIKKDLKKIVDEFAWINYTAEGVPIDLKYITGKINKILKETKDLEGVYGDKVSDSDEIAKQKKEIYDRYDFSQKEKKLFSIGAEIVFIKFFRKGVFAESYYSIEFILHEIAKRIGISERYPMFMFPEEVLAALKLNVFPEKLVAERIKNSTMLCCEGKSYPMSSKFRVVIKDMEIRDNPEIKGQVAFIGKVSGKAKIINAPSDMIKFNKGDILVSRSTNPNLVPVMEKAAAFITDIGGLTCHAAIVAREMKKPCVIGTKIATQVLKDGDLVEVDANTGVVKILEKGN